MSLTLALNSALSGLNVNQRALAVLSQNIANANTPGYSRQVVNQSAYYLDGQGAGVRIQDVTRKVDTYLQRSIQAQTSDVGEAAARSDYMDRVQILLGQPGSKNSIDAYISGFFNSLQSLAETPDRTSFRSTAISSGVVLAQQLSDLAVGLEDLRYQADQDIKTNLSVINADIKSLFSLNIAIERAYAMGAPIAGLEDQRDAALNRISERIDIEIYYRESGAVNVFTGSGVSLLDDNINELIYEPAPSVNTFINNGQLRALQVVQLDLAGNRVGNPVPIVTAGKEGAISSSLTGGSLKALVDLRDKTIPAMLAQIDTLAAGIRDEVNKIHNNGSGFPGAYQLTGTRSVVASDQLDWTGKVQIAVLDKNGQPVNQLYPGASALAPLTLDLSFLDSGSGAGKPSTQTIIDEINNYFGAPANKATVGNLDNIQLVALTDKMPAIPPSFSFDFDLSNLSGSAADFWVTNVTVLDSAGVTMAGAATNTMPTVNLAATNTFTTQLDSNIVVVQSDGPHGFIDGDMVYLSNPGAINGIPGAEINGFYRVKNVTSTTFEIEVVTAANASSAVDVLGQTVLPNYAEIDAGEKARTREEGAINLNLAAAPASPFYTVQVSVGVDDGSGNISTSVIEYRVYNNDNNLLNDRYNARAVSGEGELVLPGTTQAYARAMLVDVNGVEIPKVNGKYADQEGFLKIVAGNAEYVISISELDSKELGRPDDRPPVAGSNRGFSHFFELNNFFESNLSTSSGDTVEGSAYNMRVQQRLIDNPNLITTGRLALSNQPADPDATPLYTYERYSGDNSTAQQLAKLGVTSVSFAAAGGLPNMTQSFNGFSGEMLGYLATQAVAADNGVRDSQILLDGYQQRSQALSGVNLDEELANTIIYQNSYAASARVISVTNELFDALLNTF